MNIGGSARVRRIIKTKPRWIHVCDMLPGGRVLDATYTRCPACGTRRP